MANRTFSEFDDGDAAEALRSLGASSITSAAVYSSTINTQQEQYQHHLFPLSEQQSFQLAQESTFPNSNLSTDFPFTTGVEVTIK